MSGVQQKRLRLCRLLGCLRWFGLFEDGECSLPVDDTLFEESLDGRPRLFDATSGSFVLFALVGFRVLCCESASKCCASSVASVAVEA